MKEMKKVKDIPTSLPTHAPKEQINLKVPVLLSLHMKKQSTWGEGVGGICRNRVEAESHGCGPADTEADLRLQNEDGR